VILLLVVVTVDDEILRCTLLLEVEGLEITAASAYKNRLFVCKLLNGVRLRGLCLWHSNVMEERVM